MSTDEDESTSHKRKRKGRRSQDDSPASTSSESPTIGAPSPLRRNNIVGMSESASSDSSQGVSIKRKKVGRLSTEFEYSSEDNSSPISHRRMAFRVRMQQVIDSDSEESESDGSDVICPRRVGRFTSAIPSDSDEWETDNSDLQESPLKAKECDGKKAKIADSDSSDSDGQSEKCPICLHSFKLLEVGVLENCEHTFCLECIQEWSKNKNTCPLDRKEYHCITVKTCLNGVYVKKIPIEEPQAHEDIVDIIEDLTYCEVCGSNNNEDRLLLCDGCDMGFHLYCLNPPLDEVPEGSWYCTQCNIIRDFQSINDDQERSLLSRSLEEDAPYNFGGSSRSASRLIPRTRQAELVRRRVENYRRQRRLQAVNRNEPSTSGGRGSRHRVSSTTDTLAPNRVRRRKRPRRKKKNTKYVTVWVLNESGEAVKQKKKVSSKSKRRKRRYRKGRSSPVNIAERSTKKRLASQLGVCAQQHADQMLPDVRVNNGGNNLSHQRYQAGIRNIDLFGTANRLDDYVPSEGEDDTGVDTLLARRISMRNPLGRVMRQKAAIADTPTVSSSTDILESILQSQEILLSKTTVLSVVDSSGKLKFENKKKEIVNNNNANKPDLNSKSTKPDFSSFTVRETPWNGRYNSGGYRHNYRSNYWQNNRNQNWQNNSNRDYQGRYGGSNFNQGSSSFGGHHSQGREDFYNDIPQDYTQRTLCEAEISQEEDKDKNTPDSNTPTNDAEVDIYCDIENEMVSTSQADEYRPPSPPMPMADPTIINDEEDNDSESGMVIDTERYTEEPVSSTADAYNPELATYSPDNPTYSPGQPTYSPGQPTYSPGQPTYSPGQPTYSPAPNYSPQQPTYSPNQPAYSPGQTNYSPGEPTASPSNPSNHPEGPTCSPKSEESLPSDLPGLAVGFDKLQQELASGYESLQREIASGYDELQKEFASGFKEFQLQSAASVDSAVVEETNPYPDSSSEKDIMDSTEPDSFSHDIQPGGDPEEVAESQEVVLNIPVPPEIENENIPYPPELDSSNIPCPPEPKNSSGNDDDLDRVSQEEASPTACENPLKSPSEPEFEHISASGSEEYNTLRDLSQVDISNFTNPPALDTSDLLKIDTLKPTNDEDEFSNDGCPNFSIYSKQSKTVALTTDISMPSSRDAKQLEQVLGNIDSITDESRSQPASPQRVTVEKTGFDPRLKKKPSSGWNLGALYSDSEDETVVKKTSTFGISDLKDMTEEILSEEERSYTPVVQEGRSKSKERLDNLGTEMISDDDRNDFDESQELKMVSDADALEINAKESEIDFTRPDDFEEGEIVDKNKLDSVEKVTEPGTPEKKSRKEKKGDKDVKKKKRDKAKSKEIPENSANKENLDGLDEIFKKLSKSTRERNYRDKVKNQSKESDREESRSKSLEITDKEHKKKKRKELERYNVRAIIAEKPRPPPKDQFGRDVRTSLSRSRSYTPPLAQTPPSKPKGTPSPVRAPSPVRRKSRSLSRGKTPPRRHSPKRRSRSGSKSREKKRKARGRRSRSRGRKRERSKTKKRKESGTTIAKRRKSKEERGGKKRRRSHSRDRSRSRSISARRRREWTPSLSRSIASPLHHTSPSWTPPRNQNLTVILNNGAAKKKKDKRSKDKRTDEISTRRRRRERDRTPPPSKEVFASGDNILVSVSFNNENETREIRDNRKKNSTAERNRERRNKNRPDLSGIKPVAIIDLDRSPFQELPSSPKDVIVLSDSDNNETETGNVQNDVCDSSQQVASPEVIPSYSTGPKTPPEPSVKFALNAKPAQLRAIHNPLHDPLETVEEEPPEDMSNSAHKGPNTPPEEPPTSPPSSPDAYDPFEPTKSRSPTPEPGDVQDENDERQNQSLIDNTSNMDLEKTGQTPDIIRSLTPPMPDIQPADSQSSIQEIIETSSPGNQLQQVPGLKPVGQTIPYSSVQTTLVSSTPISSTISLSRINILSSSLITQSSTIPQRIVLPNQVKSSPVKIPPTKAIVKSTPIKPLQNKPTNKKSSGKQIGNSLDDIILDFESPYSPGSSDYEDLFEPPSEPPTVALKSKASSKAKASLSKKGGSVFDNLFGSPTYHKNSKKVGGGKKTGNKTKHVGVKIDDDSLKILEEMPNSAVEMQVKDKFLKKLNRQERVVEEVKLVLKPFYNKKKITKDEYKDIMRRAVPKICHNKSGEINPIKIRSLIEAYVKKIKHSKKVTSSSSLPQKNALLL